MSVKLGLRIKTLQECGAEEDIVAQDKSKRGKRKLLNEGLRDL
jgi:hypothetical protein